MVASAVPTREDVWEELADQFLDTETRHSIPRVALMCVEAGMSPASAFDAWAYEVTPAIFWNLWSVVGEWTGWNRESLFARIRERSVKPSRWAYLAYRFRVQSAHTRWVAIGKCMGIFQQTPAVCRERVSSELAWLARQFFDFTNSMAPPSSAERMREVYRDTFVPIFASFIPNGATRNRELDVIAERIERALIGH